MKYKLKCTDANWSGRHGEAIKLWKEDDEGRSLWPRGVPSAVPLKPMKGVNDIVKGLSGFINYWDDLCRADVSGEHRRRYENVVRYWCGVKAALQEPLPVSSVLIDGFWPTTRVEATEADHFDEDGEDLEDYGEDEPYVGPLRDRPQPSFRVARDLYEGYFVAVRPADGDSRPVWIARALSDPNSNSEQPNCVLLQYFRPTSRNQEVQDLYAGWDSERGLLWRVDDSEEPAWETTNALITAWKSQNRRGTRQCRIKIPTVQIEIINQSLALYT